MRYMISSAILLVCIILPGYAVESDHSNTVGFIKFVEIEGGDTVGFTDGFNPFMLPFTYYQPGYFRTTHVDSIIGTQAMDGSEVWSQTTYQVSTYFYGVWYSPFPLVNTDAYWYGIVLYRPYENVITTAGEVTTDTVYYGQIPTGLTPYGIPIAGNTPCSYLDLENAGLDMLEIWDQMSYAIYSFYNGSWYPDGDIIPGHPTWINNTSGAPSPNAWKYIPSNDPIDASSGISNTHNASPSRRQTLNALQSRTE